MSSSSSQLCSTCCVRVPAAQRLQRAVAPTCKCLQGSVELEPAQRALNALTLFLALCCSYSVTQLLRPSHRLIVSIPCSGSDAVFKYCKESRTLLCGLAKAIQVKCCQDYISSQRSLHLLYHVLPVNCRGVQFSPGMSSASAADSRSAAAALPVAVVLQLPRQQRLRGEGQGAKTLYCKGPSPKGGMLWICAPLLASSAGFKILPCAALHRRLSPLGLGRVLLSFC